jgi:excinuclease ABC subunit A
MDDQITIRGARLHNLKNLNLSIPKNRLVVFTGVSGSGKSTLGFDILLKEGQRQYMEALGMLPFGMSRPPVKAISGLAPTVAVDQRLTNRSPRSTVGTVTDVYTYLRVLFARLGLRPCPACGRDIPVTDIGKQPEQDVEMQSFASLPDSTFPCPHCGTQVAVLSMAHFSFNKPEGVCPTCTGLGKLQQVDLKRLADEHKSISEGAVSGWNAVLIDYHAKTLKAAAAHYGFEFDLERKIKDYTPAQYDLLFYGVESPQFRWHYPQIPPPLTVRQGRFEGVATNLLRRYADHLQQHAQEIDYHDQLEDLLVTQTCPECQGTRLRPESRLVRVGGKSIVELSRLPLVELGEWLEAYSVSLQAGARNERERLSEQEEVVDVEMQGIASLRRGAMLILDEMSERIGWLVEAGAGYLALERASPSLSAGESQRLRLASLLGSSLSGLLYVFDEPTIGLHARDTQRLIGLLRRLRDLGNTVLVIEHDLEMIAAADYVVDFGPGAGVHGGEIVAQGTPEQVATQPRSLTGSYLSGWLTLGQPENHRGPADQALTIRGARHHNLKNLTVRLPLGRLVAVTGVSGSGKSSLVFDILDRALRVRLYGAKDTPGEHEAIEGIELLDKVITIDQQHLAPLARSNAATYTDTFTPIRAAFAATDKARRLGLSTRHFSFNTPGGRCERCQGSGVLAVQMHFLPEAEVRCPACHGRRFTSETLVVRYRGYDIAQVLDLTVEEALKLFEDLPAAHSRLQALCDVGLGYLQLGQPADTLSGGEAQRVKLAKELGRRSSNRTLYLLDEPTTGQHLVDTARLLKVLQRLVGSGSSVIVIEHNLELVKAADWVVDLGPEGGAGGGRLVAEGTPEEIAQAQVSYTGKYLLKA